MKKALLSLFLLTAMIMSAQNPFFQPFDTPYGSVPFSKIKPEHYMPAIDRGIALARAEIDSITANPAAPTFQNTIVALEDAGQDLNRVINVFFNILEADSSDELMNLSLEASQKLSDYSTDITLNQALWQRVKAVYDNRASLNLSPEDSMLLQTTYDSFANSGANLQGADRETYKKLSAELSALTTTFGQNVLKEMNKYELELTSDDLDGLPEGIVAEAAELAKQKGKEGSYIFTLAQPTYMAFMKNSTRRDLRERFYRLYNGRNLSGEYDNTKIITKIADLRRQLANLMGYKTFADWKLKKTMAGNANAVYDLLNRLQEAYRPAELAEMKELNDFAHSTDNLTGEIQPWDYSYYSNKLKAAKYSFDEEALRPYFKLENVIDGVFGLATRLYGLKFTELSDVDVYHPDVKAYKVTDENNAYIGLIYTDFFPRASKRPGAWMTGFKDQKITADGTNERPHVSIVMNFTKPSAGKPSLLTPYEVETFLHEFGHSLHGLLANTRYSSLSGTSVYRDFVELPSQFNENYLTQKEFLDSFARHYQTGDSIPQELIDRLVASSRYGAAYACLRQLFFGYLDMAYHTATEPVTDVRAFEADATRNVQIFAPVEGTLVAPQFSHIFSGGYAAGYYSYKWAEVLDADAFEKFRQNGIFDRKTADSFRTNILMKGGTEDPAKLYRDFRGQDPTIDALLIRDGIIKPDHKVATPQKD